MIFKNDQEALKKYKEMLKDSNYSKTDINQSDYMKMSLLAIQQVKILTFSSCKKINLTKKM